MPIAPSQIQNSSKLVVESCLWYRRRKKPHLVMQSRNGPIEVATLQEARDYAASHGFSGITIKEV